MMRHTEKTVELKFEDGIYRVQNNPSIRERSVNTRRRPVRADSLAVAQRKFYPFYQKVEPQEETVPNYRERLRSVPEDKRRIVYEEFFSILTNYNLSTAVVCIELLKESEFDNLHKLVYEEGVAESSIPRDVADYKLLDQIAEVAVWAATGKIPRIQDV
jgi:hypothetical protein